MIVRDDNDLNQSRPRLSAARVLLRGILWGLVGALLGGLLFGLIASPMVIWEIGRISLSYTSAEWDSPGEMVNYFLRKGTPGIPEWIIVWLYWSLLTGGLGAIVALIPGVMGGVCLSILINSRAVLLHSRKETIPVFGVALGALVGMLVGVLVATPLLILYGSLDFLVGYLVLAVVAFLVAVVCGTFVGWRLALAYNGQPLDNSRGH